MILDVRLTARLGAFDFIPWADRSSSVDVGGCGRVSARPRTKSFVRRLRAHATKILIGYSHPFRRYGYKPFITL
jgi:hypothetical protein